MDTLATGEAPSLLTSEPFNLSTDESSTESQPASEASTFEKIKSAGAKVFAKHGVMFRRTGGRPRKDGSPNKGDIPLNVPITAIPAVAAPAPALPAQEGLDPVLVKKCCSVLIKTIGGFFDKLIYRKAKIVGYTPDECNQLILDCQVTSSELDSFAELSEICLRKYGVGTEYAPEIGLGCHVVGMGLRYTHALGTLEAARKAKLNGKGQP